MANSNYLYEVNSRRTYNSKLFLRGDGQTTQEFHVGHIHYFDRNEQKLKDIDWKLVWDKGKKGWVFEHHSFQPFIPEYSNGWIEFRDLFEKKDRLLRFRPLVKNRVKGRLVHKGEDNPRHPETDGIYYENAFGPNRDLQVYFTRSTMAKVATVNNPHEATEDAVFEYEVLLPNLKGNRKIYRGIKKEYQLDETRDKELDTGKQTLIGTDIDDGTERFTYLRGFQAWDSKGKTITIKTKLYRKDGKLILRKTIPLEFLKSAEGKVFTDDSASYYPGAGDGDSGKLGAANWATARGAATSDYENYTAGGGRNAWGHDGGGGGTDYYLYRGFYPLDTSGLPDTATVTAATFTITADGNATGASYNLSLTQTGQASLTELVAGDYDSITFVQGATDIARPTGAGTTAQFTLNATGRGWISKTGNTLLGIITEYDQSNTDPGAVALYVTSRFSEFANTTSDPVLVVTYTEATTTSTTTSTSSSTSTTTTSTSTSTSTTTTSTSSSTSTSTTTTSTSSSTSSSTTTTSTSSSTSSSTTTTSTSSSTSTTTTSTSTSTSTTTTSTSSSTSSSTSTSTTTTSTSTSSSTSTTTTSTSSSTSTTTTSTSSSTSSSTTTTSTSTSSSTTTTSTSSSTSTTTTSTSSSTSSSTTTTSTSTSSSTSTTTTSTSSSTSTSTTTTSTSSSTSSSTTTTSTSSSTSSSTTTTSTSSSTSSSTTTTSTSSSTSSSTTTTSTSSSTSTSTSSSTSSSTSTSSSSSTSTTTIYPFEFSVEESAEQKGGFIQSEQELKFEVEETGIAKGGFETPDAQLTEDYL